MDTKLKKINHNGQCKHDGHEEDNPCDFSVKLCDHCGYLYF